MANTKTKTKVTIDKVAVTKAWNKSVSKPVITSAHKALSKVLKGIAGMEFEGSIAKKDKGLGVSLTFTDIAMDAKKKTLTLKLEMLVSKYPGPKIATTGGSPAKIEATKLDEDAAIKRAPDLAAQLVEAKKGGLVKVLQALAKTL